MDSEGFDAFFSILDHSAVRVRTACLRLATACATVLVVYPQSICRSFALLSAADLRSDSFAVAGLIESIYISKLNIFVGCF